METLPYRTILFDGSWGVGKSYALNEALEGNLNVCKVSMFGLNNAQQIYHEALFQLALKNNIGGKIGEIADNILEGVCKAGEKAGEAYPEAGKASGKACPEGRGQDKKGGCAG